MVNNMASIGAAVREPGSTRKNKTGSWRTFKPVADKEKCIGCGLCYLYCPDGCISLESIMLSTFLILKK